MFYAAALISINLEIIEKKKLKCKKSGKFALLRFPITERVLYKHIFKFRLNHFICHVEIAFIVNFECVMLRTNKYA